VATEVGVQLQMWEGIGNTPFEATISKNNEQVVTIIVRCSLKQTCPVDKLVLTSQSNTCVY